MATPSSSKKDPFADVAADTTADPFADYVANVPAGFTPVSKEQFTAGNQPFGPWAARAGVRTLPYAGGILGGMTGGIPGATLGGMAGRGAENLLEQQALGLPKKDIHQNLMDVGTAGIEQGLFQTAGEIPGAIAKGLRGFAATKQAARVAKAAKAAEEIRQASIIRPELEHALTVSKAARKEAAANTLSAVQEAQQGVGPLSSKDIAESVVQQLQHKLEGPRNVPQMQRLVRRRLMQLSREVTHSTTPHELNLDELHLINQHLRRLNAAGHKAEQLGTTSGGLKLDRDIEQAIGHVLEDAVPNYRELNANTAQHIQDVQDISRKLGRQPRSAVQEITKAQAKRVAEARARNTAAKTVMGVHPGIPPSLYIKPGGMESLSNGLANFITNPLIRGPFFQYGPRTLGVLGAALSTPDEQQLLEEQQP